MHLIPGSHSSSRRSLLAGLAALSALAALPVRAAPAKAIHIVKVTGCSCCSAWGETLAAAGYTVTVEERDSVEVDRFKGENGVPEAMFGCHTALTSGYVIEGHVPFYEIDRLYAERPDAIGLAVPGMPVGSPGMDAGGSRDAFDVFLLQHDGTTSVFKSYAAL